MSDPLNDLLSDDDLKAVWGPPTEPDFDAWREKHAEAVAYLNPVVTQIQQRKRRILMRTLKLSALSLCLGVVIWLIGFREGTPAYAHAFKSLNDARTVTWVETNYMQCTSKDGQRTWLYKYSQKYYYRHPGLTRQEMYGDDGHVSSVSIEDAVEGVALSLDPSEKSAQLIHLLPSEKHPEGPFSYAESNLRSATEIVKTVSVSELNAVKIVLTCQPLPREARLTGRSVPGRWHRC